MICSRWVSFDQWVVGWPTAYNTLEKSILNEVNRNIRLRIDVVRPERVNDFETASCMKLLSKDRA